MATREAVQLEKSTLVAELDGAVVAAAEDEAVDEVSLTEAVVVLVAKLEVVTGVLVLARGVEDATGVLETGTRVPEGTDEEVTVTGVEEPIALTPDGIEELETRGILVGITEVVDEDAPADEETAA